jgi:Protein of unknown function (DUF2892)
MTVERGLRLMAGVMVLLSVALTCYVSHYWMWLTVLIGLNLLQSAFTNWCPAMSIFRAIGLKYAACSIARVEQFEAKGLMHRSAKRRLEGIHDSPEQNSLENGA